MKALAEKKYMSLIKRREKQNAKREGFFSHTRYVLRCKGGGGFKFLNYKKNTKKNALKEKKNRKRH